MKGEGRWCGVVRLVLQFVALLVVMAVSAMMISSLLCSGFQRVVLEVRLMFSMYL